MNNAIVIGRIKEIEENKLVLTVARPFKNKKEKYKEDFITCKLSNEMCETLLKYCEKNNLIAIKGELHSDNENMYVSVNKLTFLASKNG